MNPYEEIGVEKDATPDEIKRAYRSKAKKAHPDSGGDPEQFHALQKAYDVLSDAERRARYDETGDTGENRQNDPHSAALAIIGGLVDELTNEIIMNDNVAQTHLIKRMCGKLDKKVAEVKANQKAARDFERKTTAIRKRLKVKKGPDYIGRMLDAKLDACRVAIESADRQIELFERARAILDDADFDVEKVDPLQRRATVDDGFTDAMAYMMQFGRFSR